MSGDAQTAVPPPMMWAQRSDSIFLTICLEDCKKPDIKIHNNGLYFKGEGGTDKKVHEVKIEFYKEIDSEKSLYYVRERIIEFILHKKESGPFWPHLTKEKVKYHWLKVDFNKWEDEDDSENDSENESESNNDLVNLMKKIEERKDSGDNKPNFNDVDKSDSDDDSDDGNDESLPELW